MKHHLICIGGEDHTLRIPFLLALRACGFQVTAVSPADGARFSHHRIEHIRCGFDRFSSRAGDFAAIGGLRRLLRGLNPDIVHSFDTKPNLLTPFAVGAEVPVVRTINGLGWVFSSFELRALALRPVYCALQWLASRKSAATVFQNRDDHALFHRLGLLGRSHSRLISSSGIDATAFATARYRSPPVAVMRHQFGLDATNKVIVFVGRLTRQKGIPTLLKAVPRVVAVCPDARFVLVGPRQSEGPFAVEHDDIAVLAPHVIAPGARSDVPALLGMADVFVFPTEYREGVPRVLLEAGLAGLPVVATRMPGCNDVVEDGWNGHLVAPRDPLALADGILRLLRDPAKARLMGQRSIALVAGRFALEHVVDCYCELYEEVLSAPSARRPAFSGAASSETGEEPAARLLSGASQ